MKHLVKLFIILSSTSVLLSCNSGGSGGNSNPTVGVNPYPYPTAA